MTQKEKTAGIIRWLDIATQKLGVTLRDLQSYPALRERALEIIRSEGGTVRRDELIAFLSDEENMVHYQKALTRSLFNLAHPGALKIQHGCGRTRPSPTLDQIESKGRSRRPLIHS